MSGAAKVLFLSSSTVSYTEPGGSPSLLAMVDEQLQARQPAVEWQCAGELLYVTPSMAGRAARLARKHEPTVIVFRPTGLAFMHDDVVSRVRERWPRAYPVCVSASALLRRLSGGQRHGGAGPRSVVFRAPRWLAARLIGEAPRVRVEEATELVLQTLDELLAIEGSEILCRISVGNAESNLKREEHERRVAYFVSRVRSHCEQRHVPFEDNRDPLEAAGVSYVYSEDQWHYTNAVRSLEAAAVTESIISAVEARPNPANV